VLLSAVWDIPSGPAIVLLSTFLFFLAVVLSPKRLRHSMSSV
jgi:ABC-type Mn2+/Zn2+ transport system permease subunit